MDLMKYATVYKNLKPYQGLPVLHSVRIFPRERLHNYSLIRPNPPIAVVISLIACPSLAGVLSIYTPVLAGISNERSLQVLRFYLIIMATYEVDLKGQP
jgi:hypothetical protein